jgi:hypothetical protein
MERKRWAEPGDFEALHLTLSSPNRLMGDFGSRLLSGFGVMGIWLRRPVPPLRSRAAPFRDYEHCERTGRNFWSAGS